MRFTNPYRQTKRASFGIGLTASYDHFKPHFQERANKNQKFSHEKNFSIGIVGIISPGELFSATIGVLYATKNYLLAYNYQLHDSEDPIPFPDETQAFLSYLEIPLELNYRVWKTNKLSLYLSGGIASEILVRDSENTTYLNAHKKKPNSLKEGTGNFFWEVQSALCYGMTFINQLVYF